MYLCRICIGNVKFRIFIVFMVATALCVTDIINYLNQSLFVLNAISTKPDQTLVLYLRECCWFEMKLFIIVYLSFQTLV